ncbi:MAG: ferredoxin [Nanoarchaeota archaeon]|nr:ferredoxin [Nanoarchaeota archaeon]
MAKLVVNEEKCIGCGACTSEAPELFELIETDSGYKAKVKKEQVKGKEIEQAQAAINVCPVDVISLE